MLRVEPHSPVQESFALGSLRVRIRATKRSLSPVPDIILNLSACSPRSAKPELITALSVVGESAVALDPVMRRLEKYLDRGIKEVGQIHLLDPGKPQELFPYLDSSL